MQFLFFYRVTWLNGVRFNDLAANYSFISSNYQITRNETKTVVSAILSMSLQKSLYGNDREQH